MKNKKKREEEEKKKTKMKKEWRRMRKDESKMGGGTNLVHNIKAIFHNYQKHFPTLTLAAPKNVKGDEMLKLTRVSICSCRWHSIILLWVLMWQVCMKMWITADDDSWLTVNCSVWCRWYWRRKAAACTWWVKRRSGWNGNRRIWHCRRWTIGA